MEQKALGHTEYVQFTNPRNLELRAGQGKFTEEVLEFAIKEKLLGTGPIAFTRVELEAKASKYQDDYFDYKKKIKKALDPNGVSDSSTYVV